MRSARGSDPSFLRVSQTVCSYLLRNIEIIMQNTVHAAWLLCGRCGHCLVDSTYSTVLYKIIAYKAIPFSMGLNVYIFIFLCPLREYALYT